MAASEETCEGNPNFAVICSFITKFGDDCGVKFSIPCLQQILEDTKNVNSDFIDLIVYLMRRGGRRVNNKERWEKCLIKFCHEYSSVDAWELERFGFFKAKLSVKLEIFKRLLELQFDGNVKFKAEVNKQDAQSLRLLPLGRDIDGQAYWYQLDKDYNMRLYRESLTESNIWQLVCSTTEDLRSLLASLEKKYSDSTGNLSILKSDDCNNVKTLPSDSLSALKNEEGKYNLDIANQSKPLIIHKHLAGYTNYVTEMHAARGLPVGHSWSTFNTEDLISHISEDKPCTIIIKTEKKEVPSESNTSECAIVNNTSAKKLPKVESINDAKGSVKLKLRIDTSISKCHNKSTIEIDEDVIDKSSNAVVPMEVDLDNPPKSDADVLTNINDVSTNLGVEHMTKNKTIFHSPDKEHSDYNISNGKDDSSIVDTSDHVNHKGSKIKLYEKWNHEKKKLDEESTILAKTQDVSEQIEQSNLNISNQKSDPVVPVICNSELSENLSLDDKLPALDNQNTENDIAVDLRSSSCVNVIVQNTSSKLLLSNGMSPTSKSDLQHSENNCVPELSAKKSSSSKYAEENAKQSSIDVSECDDLPIINNEASSGVSHLQALQNMCDNNSMGGLQNKSYSSNNIESNKNLVKTNKSSTFSDFSYETISKKYNFSDNQWENDKIHSNEYETSSVLLKSNVNMADERNEPPLLTKEESLSKYSEQVPSDLSCSSNKIKDKNSECYITDDKIVPKKIIKAIDNKSSDIKSPKELCNSDNEVAPSLDKIEYCALSKKSNSGKNEITNIISNKLPISESLEHDNSKVNENVTENMQITKIDCNVSDKIVEFSKVTCTDTDKVPCEIPFNVEQSNKDICTDADKTLCEISSNVKESSKDISTDTDSKSLLEICSSVESNKDKPTDIDIKISYKLSIKKYQNFLSKCDDNGQPKTVNILTQNQSGEQGLCNESTCNAQTSSKLSSNGDEIVETSFMNNKTAIEFPSNESKTSNESASDANKTSNEPMSGIGETTIESSSNANETLDQLSSDTSKKLNEYATDASKELSEHSTDAHEKSNEHSADANEKSNDHSANANEKSNEHSVDVNEKSNEHSVDVNEKSNEFSVDVNEKSNEHSVDANEKSNEYSADANEKPNELSAHANEKPNELSADANEKSNEHSADANENSNEFSADANVKSNEHSADANEKSNEHSADANENSNEFSADANVKSNEHSIDVNTDENSNKYPSDANKILNKCPDNEKSIEHSAGVIEILKEPSLDVSKTALEISSNTEKTSSELLNTSKVSNELTFDVNKRSDKLPVVNKILNELPPDTSKIMAEPSSNAKKTSNQLSSDSIETSNISLLDVNKTSTKPEFDPNERSNKPLADANKILNESPSDVKILNENQSNVNKILNVFPHSNNETTNESLSDVDKILNKPLSDINKTSDENPSNTSKISNKALCNANNLLNESQSDTDKSLNNNKIVESINAINLQSNKESKGKFIEVDSKSKIELSQNSNCRDSKSDFRNCDSVSKNIETDVSSIDDNDELLATNKVENSVNTSEIKNELFKISDDDVIKENARHFEEKSESLHKEVNQSHTSEEVDKNLQKPNMFTSNMEKKDLVSRDELNSNSLENSLTIKNVNKKIEENDAECTVEKNELLPDLKREKCLNKNFSEKFEIESCTLKSNTDADCVSNKIEITEKQLITKKLSDESKEFQDDLKKSEITPSNESKNSSDSSVILNEAEECVKQDKKQVLEDASNNKEKTSAIDIVTKNDVHQESSELLNNKSVSDLNLKRSSNEVSNTDKNSVEHSNAMLDSIVPHKDSFEIYNLRHSFCLESRLSYTVHDMFTKNIQESPKKKLITDLSFDLSDDEPLILYSTAAKLLKTQQQKGKNSKSNAKKKPITPRKPSAVVVAQAASKKLPQPVSNLKRRGARGRKKEIEKDFTIPEGFLEILGNAEKTANEKITSSKRKKGESKCIASPFAKDALASLQSSDSESTPRKRSRRIQEQHQKKMTELAVEMEREQRRLEQMAKRSNVSKNVKSKTTMQKTPVKVNAKSLNVKVTNTKSPVVKASNVKPRTKGKLEIPLLEEETVLSMDTRRATRKMNHRSKNLTKMTLMYEDDSQHTKDSQNSTSRETEKSKRRRRGHGRRKGYKPWDLSSESTSSVEEMTEEEEEEEPEEILIFDVNEDEFACEEVDPNAEPVVIRRARTAKKTEGAAEEVVNDDKPCKKCGKFDKPEWILLCDKCDSGYHTHCLIPPLMIVPDGDWFCQPCEHMLLCHCLQEEIQKLDHILMQREREALRKQRLAYVGISLDNVLKPEKKEKSDEETSKEETENEEDREQEKENSLKIKKEFKEEDERHRKLYGQRSVRARRNVNYQFKEYDELIASAIQDEMVDLKLPEEEFKEECENEEGSEAGSDRPFTARVSKRKRKSRSFRDLDNFSDDEDSGDDYEGGSTDSEATLPPPSNSEESNASDADWCVSKTKSSRSTKSRRQRKSGGRRRRKRHGDSSEEDWDEEELDESDNCRPATRRSAAQKAISYREISSEEDEWNAKPQKVSKRRKSSSSESEASYKQKSSKKKRIQKWASSDSEEEEEEEEKSMTSSEEESSEEGESDSGNKAEKQEKLMLKASTNKKVLSTDEEENEESSTQDSLSKRQKKVLSESEEEEEDESESDEESEEDKSKKSIPIEKKNVPEKVIASNKTEAVNNKSIVEIKGVVSEKVENTVEKTTNMNKELEKDIQPKVLIRKEICSSESIKQSVTTVTVSDKAPLRTIRKEATKMVPCVIPYDRSPKYGHASEPEEEIARETGGTVQKPVLPNHPTQYSRQAPPLQGSLTSSRIQLSSPVRSHSYPHGSSTRPPPPPPLMSGMPPRMPHHSNIPVRPPAFVGNVSIRHPGTPSRLAVRPSNLSTTSASTKNVTSAPTIQNKSDNKPYKSTIMEPFEENDSDDEVPLERIPTACVPPSLPNRPVSFEKEAEYRPAAKELSPYFYAPPEEKSFPSTYTSLTPFQDYSSRPSPLKPSLVETYPNNSSPSKLTPLDTYSRSNSPKGFISLDSFTENKKKKGLYGNSSQDAEPSNRPPRLATDNYQGGEIRFPPEPYPCPQSPNTYQSPPPQRDAGTPPRLYSQFPDAYAPPRSPEYYQNHQYYASEERIPRPSYQPNYVAPEPPSFVSNPYVATPVPQPNGGFMIDTLLRARNHENEEDELTGVTDIVSYITQE